MRMAAWTRHEVESSASARITRITGSEAVNSIVSVNLEPSDDYGSVLVEGNDFYSSPRLESGWDSVGMAHLESSEHALGWLRVVGRRVWRRRQARFDADGWPAAPRSRFFSQNGHLTAFCISPRTKRLVESRADFARRRYRKRLLRQKAELGMPQWMFGMSSYSFASADLIVCSHIEHGVSTLATLDVHIRQVTLQSIALTQTFNICERRMDRRYFVAVHRRM